MTSNIIRVLPVIALLLLAACGTPGEKGKTMTESTISEQTITVTIDTLIARHGEAQRARIERGVRQVARLWREDDGSAADFQVFCTAQFIGDPDLLDASFERLQTNLMLIGGYLDEMGRDLNAPLQLEQGPILPIDYQFGEFSPGAHVNEDLFKTKIAFTVLLNFPLSTLKERLENGDKWSRRQWAETRLADGFDTRVPSEANQALNVAYTNADNYISSYNIVMHNVLTKDGQRLFPEGLSLITHWGLRDELKAQYAKPDGVSRQKLIHQIMERIITQEIPAEVINNPSVDWSIADNAVAPFGKKPTGQAAPRENDVRYQHWLNIFNAERSVDPYHPDNPTHIARRFNEDREIPEERVEELFVSILSSPEIKQTAALIKQRLGRELEAFDIWYPGFKSKPAITEDELDRIVARKYPTVEAFENGIPDILTKLGFSFDRAKFLASHITVDPSRGAGHAMGPGRLVDNAHLRTRVPESGMNYKGYNIAVHELGHNVEQVMSFQLMDYTLLRGVPNTAFTEGFAFVFQSRDLELLGLRVDDPRAKALNTLDVLWSTYEIAGVALVDMRVWRWMYDHPDATPAQLREAVLGIATEVWNSYYAPVLGVKDEPLLCIYSHMIDAGMYTPDYPLGHIIAFQVEQYLEGKNLGKEMERMCAIGSVAPDLWMRTAVGASISTQPMLDAAHAALTAVQ
ncbi:MAG: hypothetical protein IH600_06580 [Bacteroidetes bacterium]|nr:hypothetical protein [Bacteroidota bacterium]